MSSKIIILNGTSSAGKSTLAKELKNLLPNCYHLGMDDFLPSVPDSHFDSSDNPDISKVGIHAKLTEDQKNIIDYTLLPKGYFFQKQVYAAVAAFCIAPMTVIFDTLIIDETSLNTVVEQLANHEVFFVSVYCSEEQRKEREIKRGDRESGLYKLKANYIYTVCPYDIQVDTTNKTPLVAAQEVIKSIDSIESSVLNNMLKGKSEK